MRNIFIFFAFFFLLFNSSIAQRVATGTVFNDANGNGMLDSNESGISEVAVSNGRNVVLTDENGNYKLAINEKEATIFVIKPSGYRLPVDKKNRPQFYYLHKPNGSPNLAYNGVEPTGNLPENINFALRKTDQKKKFNVLLFGDPQPYNKREVNYFDRDIVSELNNVEGYEFGITLGDIVGDNLDLYKSYSNSIRKIGIPWFQVMGNHDMNYDVKSDSLADETFEATFGPPTYSFNYGDAHFIILDDIIYPRRDGKSGYIGGFTDKQLSFIEKDLKQVSKEKLIVLAFHIPIFLEEYGGPTFRLEDRRQLFDLLKDYPHTLSLSAHTHMQQFHFFDEDDGWKRRLSHMHYNVGTTNGDWWSGVPDDRGIPPTTMRDGTPNGYAMLNIDGSNFTIDYKVAEASDDYKMSIWGPEVVPQNSWHGAEIYVNYFLGSEFTEVEYRVKGEWKQWHKMSKTSEADPTISTLRQKWDTADKVLEGKRPSNPVSSPHLWKTGVPNNLPLGEQTIEIRVTDMFGREFRDSFSYEVVEAK